MVGLAHEISNLQLHVPQFHGRHGLRFSPYQLDLDLIFPLHRPVWLFQPEHEPVTGTGAEAGRVHAVQLVDPAQTGLRQVGTVEPEAQFVGLGDALQAQAQDHFVNPAVCRPLLEIIGDHQGRRHGFPLSDLEGQGTARARLKRRVRIPAGTGGRVVVLVLRRHDLRIRQLSQLLVKRSVVRPVAEPVSEVQPVHPLFPIVAGAGTDHFQRPLPEAV